MSQGIKADSDVGGRGRSILPLKNITEIASVWQSEVCCRGIEKAVFLSYIIMWTVQKQPLNKQMDGFSEAICSFKNCPFHNNNMIAKSVTSVLSWEGFQLTIPSSQTPSTACCVFFLCSRIMANRTPARKASPAER